MRAKQHPGSALLALIAAATALDPALAAAQAEGEGTEFSYRYQDYDEDALAGESLGGDTARYTVSTHQFRVATRLGDELSLVAEGLAEAMSGSSPWFVLPDANGQPLQVMSGATIADDRQELGLSLKQEPTTGNAQTWRATWSNEDDYASLGFGYERAREWNAQASWAWGVSGSYDRIEPTDAELYGRVSEERKRSFGAFASITRVLNRNAQLQAGIALSHSRGFLSDPYKQVFVVDNIVPDTRPEKRTQVAAILRYRHAVTAEAALHLDYRLARDDWGVLSHALEARWLQDLGHGVELTPSMRYYSQRAAEFYAPFHRARRDDAEYSSDYRLGEFGAWSLGVSLRKQWQGLALTVAAERYRSDTGYALGSADAEVPGLVDFTRYTIGFDYRF